MNTKRIIVLGFALVAASAAALLARGMMGGGTPAVQARIAPPPTPMSEVLVASANLQPGQALTAASVKWQNWPATAVDASFITHATTPNLDDALKGTVVRAPLVAGQPITNVAIVHGDAAGFMAAMLTPGMRAVSITITADSGAGGFVLPNDRVDIIQTTKSNDSPPRVRVKTILGNVRVLAVDQTFKEDKDTKTVVGKTATLELSPSQAELIAAAEITGALSLSLRGLGDNTAVADAQAAPKANADDGPVSIIRYGVVHPNDNSSTVQGEKSQ